MSIPEDTTDRSSLPSHISTISCTTVLLSEDHKDPPLQCHTFLYIPISNLLLGNRTGVSSILIGSILVLLRQRIATEHGVPDDLVQIIRHGERPGLDEITVATTRVPVFGTYMQDPTNCYRPLGRLSSIEVQLQLPSTAIQCHRELLAVVESDLAVAENFPNAWAPSGLTMKSHFIVIFDWVSSFPKSPLSVRPVRCISITDLLRGLEDASTDSHRENSPVSEIDTAFQSSSNSPVSVTGQAASSRDMPVLEPRTSIETICHRCQITDDQIRSARFQTAAKSLLRTVLNYKSMSHILLQLGLQERDAPFVPLQTVTLPGDLVVSAGEVVKHFGWTVESFKHKTVWYGWAEQAASSQEWNEPTPTDGHSNYSAYRVWLAIKYFWGPQGPVILGRFRDDAVVNGKDALSLKQSQIHQFQAIITRHIRLRRRDGEDSGHRGST